MNQSVLFVGQPLNLFHQVLRLELKLVRATGLKVKLRSEVSDLTLVSVNLEHRVKKKNIISFDKVPNT